MIKKNVKVVISWGKKSPIGLGKEENKDSQSPWNGWKFKLLN